jgi:hypothetical protein
VLYPDAPGTTPLRRLVYQAAREGRLGQATVDILRAGVVLRNRLAHPQGASAFTLGMVASVLRVCHLVVRDICVSRGLNGHRGS